MAGQPRTAYFSKSKRKGRPEVDEGALVKRYVRDKWNLGQCANRFSTTESHVREILAAHDVAIRASPRMADLDEDAVLRMYDRDPNTHLIATALGTDHARIKAIVEKHSAEIAGTGSKPRLWYEPEIPSPSDLLHPAQAAQVLGRAKDFLYQATLNGQIKEASRTEGGMRLYRRDAVEDLRDRLTNDEEYRL
jgi:hypothetical protein